MNYSQRNIGEAGFTLVELMISLLLGLVIVAVVITIFLSSARAKSFQQSQITLQENSRYMHLILGSVLRQTGFLPMKSAGGELIQQKTILFPAETSNIKFATDGQVIGGVESTTNSVANDQFSIRYQVDSMTVNCFGETTSAASMPQDSLESNTYRVNADGFLECERVNSVKGTETQTIIGSSQGSINQRLTLTSMLVRYGQDTDDDRSIDTITRANAVTNWAQVRSIELLLTLQAGNELNTKTVSYFYDLPNIGV
ncbi:MAG: prepilin-type N-terminal cleavage/methylation domain-containing protein [Gammaproteobacteria bacterium]|nr:prepilin-type N-terminal cleavage/methylation domain-containing protein [Gammaproteobacteria bacterium]